MQVTARESLINLQERVARLFEDRPDFFQKIEGFTQWYPDTQECQTLKLRARERMKLLAKKNETIESFMEREPFAADACNAYPIGMFCQEVLDLATQTTSFLEEIDHDAVANLAGSLLEVIVNWFDLHLDQDGRLSAIVQH